MNWTRVARTFVAPPPPLPTGTLAPLVSLTADDGSWFRSADYRGRSAIALVFLSDLTSEAAIATLRAVDALRATIEGGGGLVYVVHHARPDSLRAARERSGVGVPFLYDLLAWNSRELGQSGRRPYVRDGWLVLDADGRVIEHQPGRVDVDALARAWASLVGAPAATTPTSSTEVDWARAEALLSGADPWFLLDVRTPDEYASLKHPAARNIPVDELPNRVAELGGRTRRVLTVCQTGPRSQAALGYLVAAGFTEVASVKTGMAGWPGPKA